MRKPPAKTDIHEQPWNQFFIVDEMIGQDGSLGQKNIITTCRIFLKQPGMYSCRISVLSKIYKFQKCCKTTPEHTSLQRPCLYVQPLREDTLIYYQMQNIYYIFICIHRINIPSDHFEIILCNFACLFLIYSKSNPSLLSLVSSKVS